MFCWGGSSSCTALIVYVVVAVVVVAAVVAVVAIVVAGVAVCVGQWKQTLDITANTTATKSTL